MRFQGPSQTQMIRWKTDSCSTRFASPPHSNANIILACQQGKRVLTHNRQHPDIQTSNPSKIGTQVIAITGLAIELLGSSWVQQNDQLSKAPLALTDSLLRPGRTATDQLFPPR